MAKRKVAPKRKSAPSKPKPRTQSRPKQSSKPANVIFVPATEPGAYNPNRAAGKLLLSQTLHLREALQQHKKELDAALAIDPAALKSEGEVSAYIHRATALLHTHSSRAGK